MGVANEAPSILLKLKLHSDILFAPNSSKGSSNEKLLRFFGVELLFSI